MPRKVLISDFDGTITAEDFYHLVVQRLLPPEALGPWAEYRAGRISHFEALRRIFAEVHVPERDLLDVVRDMRPDPQLAEAVAALRKAGWEVIVASAGCEWYIKRILATAGVTLTVHTNLCDYTDGGPLLMRAPLDSPFYCEETGIDKTAIVRDQLDQGALVAYAGDGFTDVPAALMLPAERRYARADLAASLREKGEGFHPFAVWSDIARHLLGTDHFK